jgi:hypothetical protein
MDQVKNTTVRFGITDPKDFAESGQAGDWRRIDVTFPAPFGVPKPGFPKGVPQEISVVVTPLEMRVAPVAVVKKVTNTGFAIAQNVSTHGFTAALRNTDSINATAEFYWIAIGCQAGCG